MPYIPQHNRTDVGESLHTFGLGFVPENAGQLNFVVSTFIANFIRVYGLKYANLNEMVGALECAKMELNRVIIGPYEDLKIEENGGVYDEILPAQEY